MKRPIVVRGAVDKCVCCSSRPWQPRGWKNPILDKLTLSSYKWGQFILGTHSLRNPNKGMSPYSNVERFLQDKMDTGRDRISKGWMYKLSSWLGA